MVACSRSEELEQVLEQRGSGASYSTNRSRPSSKPSFLVAASVEHYSRRMKQELQQGNCRREQA